MCSYKNIDSLLTEIDEALFVFDGLLQDSNVEQHLSTSIARVLGNKGVADFEAFCQQHQDQMVTLRATLKNKYVKFLLDNQKKLLESKRTILFIKSRIDEPFWF